MRLDVELSGVPGILLETHKGLSESLNLCTSSFGVAQRRGRERCGPLKVVVVVVSKVRVCGSIGERVREREVSEWDRER